MKQVLLVFLGGGFGSVLRYALAKVFNTNSTTGFPLGTFLANVLGSLFIGLILGYLSKNNTLSQNYTLLLATGFCGGFTTFSSFAYENNVFLKQGDFYMFAFYTLATFVIAFLAVFAGLFLIKYLY